MLEKSLGVESSVSCSVGLEEKNGKSSAHDGSLACDISKGSKDSTSPLFVKCLWFWLARADKSTVISKLLDLLR